MLNSYGIGLEQVRTTLERRQRQPAQRRARRRQRHRGSSTPPTSCSRRASTAADRRLSERRAPSGSRDVANVHDSVEDLRNAGLANGKPAVLIIIFRQPGANIIDTVDRVRALLPQLQASIPPAIKLSVVVDRTTTIRASVDDVRVHADDLDRPGDPGRVPLPAQRAGRRSSRASPCRSR